MKFSSIVAAVASAAVVTGSPIEKRQNGGVLMCTGAKATGTCQYKVYEMDKCYDLAKPYYQNINTFAPDGESFECFPRVGKCSDVCTSPTGCTFGAVDFNYEHKWNFTAIEWNDLFSSFDCQAKKASS